LAEVIFSALASTVLPLLLLLLDDDFLEELFADALLAIIFDPFDDDDEVEVEVESENDDLYDLVLPVALVVFVFAVLDLPALDGTDKECDIGADLLVFEYPGFVALVEVVAGSVAPVVVGGLMGLHSHTVLINCGSTSH